MKIINRKELMNMSIKLVSFFKKILFPIAIGSFFILGEENHQSKIIVLLIVGVFFILSGIIIYSINKQDSFLDIILGISFIVLSFSENHKNYLYFLDFLLIYFFIILFKTFLRIKKK